MLLRNCQTTEGFQEKLFSFLRHMYVNLHFEKSQLSLIIQYSIEAVIGKIYMNVKIISLAFALRILTVNITSVVDSFKLTY